jgi:hypothetical protein
MDSILPLPRCVALALFSLFYQRRPSRFRKRHPFFLAFGESKLPLRALSRCQALHYPFISRALAPGDAGKGSG